MSFVSTGKCPNCHQIARTYRINTTKDFWIYCPLCNYSGASSFPLARSLKTDILVPISFKTAPKLCRFLNFTFGVSINTLQPYRTLWKHFYWYPVKKRIVLPFYVFPGPPAYGFYFEQNRLMKLRFTKVRRIFYGIGFTDGPLRNPEKDIYIFPLFDLPKALALVVREDESLADQFTTLTFPFLYLNSPSVSLLQAVTGKKLLFWKIPHVHYSKDHLLNYAWTSYRVGGDMCLYGDLDSEVKGSILDFIDRKRKSGSILSSKEVLHHLFKTHSRRHLGYLLRFRKSLSDSNQLMLCNGNTLDFVDGCWFHGPTMVLNFNIRKTYIRFDDTETWCMKVEFEDKMKEMEIEADNPTDFWKKFRKEFMSLFGEVPVCKLSTSEFLDFVMAMHYQIKGDD